MLQIVENRMNARILETVSWTPSSASSSHSAQQAMIPVKAQVFLTWINWLAAVIVNTTLAILIHFRKANNQNLKIWHLTEVPEIWGWPAWNSKCQIQRCCSIFQMEQQAKFFWWLYWAVLVWSLPLFNTNWNSVGPRSEWVQRSVSPQTDLVTQFYWYILLYKTWVVVLYFRKMKKILPETMLLI